MGGALKSFEVMLEKGCIAMGITLKVILVTAQKEKNYRESLKLGEYSCNPELNIVKNKSSKCHSSEVW